MLDADAYSTVVLLDDEWITRGGKQKPKKWSF